MKSRKIILLKQQRFQKLNSKVVVKRKSLDIEKFSFKKECNNALEKISLSEKTELSEIEKLRNELKKYKDKYGELTDTKSPEEKLYTDTTLDNIEKMMNEINIGAEIVPDDENILTEFAKVEAEELEKLLNTEDDFEIEIIK